MGTRSRICYGGWEVWVHVDSAIKCCVYVNIVRSTVPYYVYVEIICTHIRHLKYIQSAMLYKNMVL